MDATLVAEKRSWPAGTPYRFPPCHETVRRPVPCAWVQKESRSPAPAVLAVLKIARTESYRDGSIPPAHPCVPTFDYGTAEAHTTYGRIGIKVWIYKGEVLPTVKAAAKKEAPEGQEGGAK